MNGLKSGPMQYCKDIIYDAVRDNEWVKFQPHTIHVQYTVKAVNLTS